MKKIISTVTILILLGPFLFSQEYQYSTGDRNAKNAIYAYGGSLLLISSAGFAYERNILSTDKVILNSLWLKGRASYFQGWVDAASNYDISMVALTGISRYHFEFDLGLGMLYPSKDLSPTLSFGFRRQKQSGGLIFRTGIGYPEFIYLSFGGAF